MPTRKKPHPRSLDALFPRPKVKRCGRGHSQSPEWRPTRGCSTCRQQDEEAASLALARAHVLAGLADAEREHWRRVLPKLPPVFVMRSTDGRSVQTFHAGPRRAKARA